MLKHSILVIAMCLGGCTTFRNYSLPIAAAEARSTLAPVALAAGQLGFQSWRWDDSVGVRVDAQTNLSYMFTPTNAYIVCVQLNGKLPRGGVEEALAAGKRTSDRIWERAMSIRVPVQIRIPAAEPAEVEPEQIPSEQTIVTH
jgi:hypothetical protein